MRLYPRKLHGPEVKCRGAPWCEDCEYRKVWIDRLAPGEIAIPGFINMTPFYQSLFIGRFTPKETTMACICDNCGYRWSQPVVAFALKNSLDHWDSCEMCNPRSGAV